MLVDRNGYIYACQHYKINIVPSRPFPNVVVLAVVVAAAITTAVVV